MSNYLQNVVNCIFIIVNKQLEKKDDQLFRHSNILPFRKPSLFNRKQYTYIFVRVLLTYTSN